MSLTTIIISIIFGGMLISVTLMALGWTLYADPDRAWSWMDANSQRRGEHFERTPEWDARTAIVGLMLMVIGALMMLFLLWSML